MKNIKGFTLIEITVGMIIIGLLMVMILNSYKLFIIGNRLDKQAGKYRAIQTALRDFISDPHPELYADTGVNPVQFESWTENFPNAYPFITDTGYAGDKLAEYVGARLPCPAPLDVLMGSAQWGREQVTYTGNDPATLTCDTSGGGVYAVTGTGGETVFIGALPTVTLGIEGGHMTDAYGNRFTYAVTESLAKWQGLVDSGAPGAITINGYDDVADSIVNQTQSAQFALVSHGQNGAGSYTGLGTVNGNACPTAAADQDGENCDYLSGGDAVFLLRSRTEGSLNYDDQVTWSFSSAAGGGDQWWEPTDNTAQHIQNRNVGNVILNGNVGMGTASPRTKLDVAGAIKPGDQTQSGPCNANAEGALRYDRPSKSVQFCDGSTWKPMGGGGGFCPGCPCGAQDYRPMLDHNQASLWQCTTSGWTHIRNVRL